MFDDMFVFRFISEFTLQEQILPRQIARTVEIAPLSAIKLQPLVSECMQKLSSKPCSSIRFS